MALSCVVHYDLYSSDLIVALSDKAHEKLLEAKTIRTADENFANQHLEQSASIPDVVNKDVDGIHWECYKKYAHIIYQSKSAKKRKSAEDSGEIQNQRPKRGSSEFLLSEKTGVELFPLHCFFCKQVKKRESGRLIAAHKISNAEYGKSILDAARRKNDETMLLHLENQDLWAREFRLHDTCRRNYVRDKGVRKEKKDLYAAQNRQNIDVPAPAMLRSGRVLPMDNSGVQEEVTEHGSCSFESAAPLYEPPHEIIESVENEQNSITAAHTLINVEVQHREKATFDLETVKHEIVTKVFGRKETVSMKIVHELYNDGHPHDTRYRAKLKAKLKDAFGDRIKFLQQDRISPEIIAFNDGSSENLKESFDRKAIVTEAAKIMRTDILEYANEWKTTVDEWPPTLTVLKALFRAIPETVVEFLETLLKDPAHGTSDRIQRLVRSYSCDLIHGVTAGKLLTLKHYLIGLGLHNMGGQKLLVKILSLLGHSVPYDTVVSAETALAELSQLKAETGMSSGLQPTSNDGFVYTYFWADNFNKKVESEHTSMIDSTHMIKFQEDNEDALYQDIVVQKLEKSRSKFRPRVFTEITDLQVKRKLNPEIFKSFDKNSIESETNLTVFRSLYVIWLLLRHKTQLEMLLPNFAAWRLSARKFKKSSVQKTVVTYLPPINASVNEFSTIYRYLTAMQKLCFEVNMPYVNVTLDCGAAINAYKLIWNYPTVFDNIIIHLGDFHFMKEIFTVLGRLVKGSGFEDIVFLSNLSSSGSLNGIINGSHYNRCWNVHEHLSEALERLLYLRYLSEASSSSAHDVHNDLVINFCDGNDEPLIADESLCNTVKSFLDFKQNVRKGRLGKTPQFWMTNYLDIIYILHSFHIAVQESNYELRLKGYLDMMPYFFGLNLTNYSRYGSYYLCQMLNMEERYPGNEDILKKYGISVQGQDKYPLRTAIDQRGEQTLNRDAKVSGGITAFAVDEASVSKWTLNRSSLAEITNELKQFAGVNSSDEVYKHSRPAEIVKSNKSTNAVVSVLTNEYIDPFDKELDPSKLYNLSSGIPVSDEVADGILQILTNGETQFDLFVSQRLTSDATKFFKEIHRIKIQLFSHTGKKVEVVVNGKSKLIEANSNIISKLLALSTKFDRKIDMKIALSYPLCFTPLNLAHSDGARRKTDKSMLAKILLKLRAQETAYPKKHDVIAYILDLMAMIRARPCTPATFRDLVFVIIDMIPSGFQRIDIVADTYREDSIKDPERIGRGMGEKVLVKSSQTSLPRNFEEFLKNGENKKRLIEIFKDVLIDEREFILEQLNCEVLYYSMDNICFAFKMDGVEQCPELSSNQEEADTKMIMHCVNALDSNDHGNVVIRSHSGDTDINVLATSLILNNAGRTFVDYNTGDYREVLCLGDVDLIDEEKSALIGLHSFTGNDYASSFFKKSKKSCWKTLTNNPKFFKTFSTLGNTWNPSEELQSELEEFVCLLFGGNRRMKKINDLRHYLYKKKFENKEKVIDLSLLPPCFQSLQLHIYRTNYIARRYKLSNFPLIDEPDKKNHGWDENGQINWVIKAYPSEVDLLLAEENDSESDAEVVEYVEPGDESEGSDNEEY